MTINLEKAIEVARALPAEQQDEVARLMMLASGADVDEPIYELSPEEEAAVRIGIEQADRGDFATDEEMRALWAKFER